MKLPVIVIVQIIISIIVEIVNAGTIIPAKIPIITTISNMEEKSDYTFVMSLETGLDMGNVIQVVFPDSYVDELGISYLTSDACTPTCTLSSRTVSFTIQNDIQKYDSSNPTANQISLTLTGVLNPSRKGGSGNFIARSLLGKMVYDENLSFSSIGIGDKVLKFPFAKVTISNNSAGAVSTYNFEFKTSIYFPKETFIQITLDSQSGFPYNPLSPNIPCSAYKVNGYLVNASFVCKRISRLQIQITGFNTFVSAEAEIGISMTLANPPYSQTTGDFTIALFRDKTSYIYSQRNDVNGVYIAPSALTTTSVTTSITNAVISKQKRMDYIIAFDPLVSLPGGYVILIDIPSTFQILQNSNYDFAYVISGLQNENDKIIKITYTSSTQIQISNFQSVTGITLIKILVRLRNPDLQGLSAKFNVSIYYGTQLMFQGSVGAVTVQNISSADPFGVTLTSFIADNTITDFTFNILPSQPLPNNSIIYIQFPTDFTLSVSAASDCKIAGTNSNSCSVVAGNKIKIVNNANRSAGVQYQIQIINKIKKPGQSYTALIDILFKQSDDTTLIESHSEYILLQPIALSVGDTTMMLGSYSNFNVLTVLNIRFTLPANLLGPTDNSFIEFKIDTGTFDVNFGITGVNDFQSIPCAVATESQLLAITNKFTCNIRINGVQPGIYITGFTATNSGQLASIFIPNLKLNANLSSFKYILSTGKVISNYVYYIHSTGAKTFTLPLNTNSIDIQTSTYTSPPSTIQIGQSFNLIYPTTHSSRIGSLLYVILPTYADGFIRSTSTNICCPSTTLVSCDCYYFKSIDQAIIQIPKTSTDWLNGQFPTLVLNNLIYPSYTNPLLNPLVWYKYSFDNSEYGIYQDNSFPVAQVRSFVKNTVTASQQGANYVGVVYSFTFTPQDSIPSGGVISIIFPTLFSDPQPQVNSVTLVSLSSTSPIQVTFNQNIIMITNFVGVSALQEIDVTVSGVRNPTTEGINTGNWVIQTSTSGYLINVSPSFGSFTVTGSFTPSYVIFYSTSCYPTNMGEFANYYFSIKFPNSLAIGTQIRIKFPSEQYIQLPQTPSCIITSGLLGFQSCTLDGTTFVITTNTNYLMEVINVKIENILNPNSDQTKPFEVQTLYDNTIVNLTDESTTTNRVINLQSTGNPLKIQTVEFSPRNEGEISTYTFSFIPTSSLNSDNVISIQFPKVYDRNLGSSVYCSSQGLNSQINCSVKDRVVIISGIVSYTPSPTNPIVLSVVNVVNPNKVVNQNTGHFTVATLLKDSISFIDSNSTAIVLEMLTAPGWTILYNMTASSSYSRLKADYVFNLETFKQIPASTNQGSLIIQFPTQFNIPDTSSLTCVSSNTQYSGSGLTCSVASNKVSVIGNTNSYNGAIQLTLKQIKNPTLEISIDNLQLLVYDGFQKAILERTYSNLDPITKSFTYSGPLINVNNGNPITIEGGTVSDYIVISLAYPCALDLIIKPISKGKLSLIPGSISLNRGDDQVTFRISVPQNLDIGTYYIQWEIVNDLSVPYYTPIQDTVVKVTANGNNLISISPLNSIPYMGNSLITTISMTNPPDTDITIYLSFSSYYEGVTLSKSQLVFKQGVTSGQFYIQSQQIDNENYAERGTIILKLQGTNKDIYQLQTNFLDFKVVQRDYIIPVINSVTLDVATLSQTVANINVAVSEIAMVYYMVALAGTQKPTQQELIDSGPPPFLSSQSVYGKVLTDIETAIALIQFNTLQAGNDYVLYVMAQDRGQYYSAIQSLNFSTQPKFRTAQFVVRFLKSSMNEVELQVARKTIAFILSVSEDQVLSKVTARRLLKTNSLTNVEDESNQVQEQTQQQRQLASTIDVTMYLVSDFSRSNFPTPVQLVDMLNNSKQAELFKRLNNYDQTWTITYQPYPIVVPALASVPTIGEKSANSITLNFKATNPVYVYCVLITGDSVIPEPIQVYRGLNSKNKEVPSNSTFIDAGKSASFVIASLSSDTAYKVYIVAGSDQPGFPDLQDKNSMYKLDYTTDKQATVVSEDTSSFIKQFSIKLFFIIILVYYQLV